MEVGIYLRIIVILCRRTGCVRFGYNHSWKLRLSVLSHLVTPLFSGFLAAVLRFKFDRSVHVVLLELKGDVSCCNN